MESNNFAKQPRLFLNVKDLKIYNEFHIVDINFALANLLIIEGLQFLNLIDNNRRVVANQNQKTGVK